MAAMNRRDRPWVVKVKKYLPEAMGGIRFHDRLVRKMRKNFDKPHQVWESIHQHVINDIFNQGEEKNWTGVPILSQVDCPCDPGCLLLVGPKTYKSRLRIAPEKGCLVGTYHDFLPPGVTDRSICLKLPVVTSLRRRTERRVYQCRSNENAIIVSMVLQDVADIAHALTPANTFIVLDNFDGTFFNADYCYVVSRVIIAERVTIETTMNGTDYYEARYTAPTAVCFQAMKVQIQNPVSGIVSSIKPAERPLYVKLNRRRRYQYFINVFAPNQSRLGNDVGDCPAIITTTPGTTVYRSVRPRFLPRPDRRCHFGVYYFRNSNERSRIIQIIKSGGIPSFRPNGDITSSSSSDDSDSDSDSDSEEDDDENDGADNVDRDNDVVPRPAGNADGGMAPSSDEAWTSDSGVNIPRATQMGSIAQNNVTSGSANVNVSIDPSDTDAPQATETVPVSEKPRHFATIAPVINSSTDADDEDDAYFFNFSSLYNE